MWWAMYVTEFRVRNYKSFRDTQCVELTPGFNVIVGRNNAGKTALIEALSLRFASKAHQSLETRPRSTTPITGPSTVELQVRMSRDELHELVATLAPTIQIPTPENDPTPTSTTIDLFRIRYLS